MISPSLYMSYCGVVEVRSLEDVLGATCARGAKSQYFDCGTRQTPRTENLVASAVQWAERIMRKVESTAGK
jgi:hypothetical protein